MSLVAQWRELESGLPERWQSAHLRLEVGDANVCDRSAALLAPAQPYLLGGGVLRFDAAHDGSAPSPDLIARLLAQLDREKIAGTLVVTGTDEAAATAPEPEESLLAEAWDRELAQIPADWSDVLGEIDLLSSDYIERAALLCAPLNPRRDGDRSVLLFRAAAHFGYGASPAMVRRCFERCDGDGIRGSVTILRALSGTRPVATQGPVWLMAGKTV